MFLRLSESALAKPALEVRMPRGKSQIISYKLCRSARPSADNYPLDHLAGSGERVRWDDVQGIGGAGRDDHAGRRDQRAPECCRLVARDRNAAAGGAEEEIETRVVLDCSGFPSGPTLWALDSPVEGTDEWDRTRTGDRGIGRDVSGLAP